MDPIKTIAIEHDLNAIKDMFEAYRQTAFQFLAVYVLSFAWLLSSENTQKFVSRRGPRWIACVSMVALFFVVTAKLWSVRERGIKAVNNLTALVNNDLRLLPKDNPYDYSMTVFTVDCTAFLIFTAFLIAYIVQFRENGTPAKHDHVP